MRVSPYVSVCLFIHNAHLSEILDALKNKVRCDGFGRLFPLSVDPGKEDRHRLAISRIKSDVLSVEDVSRVTHLTFKWPTTTNELPIYLGSHNGGQCRAGGCEDDLVGGIRSHHVFGIRRTFGPKGDVAEGTVYTVFIEKFVEIIHRVRAISSSLVNDGLNLGSHELGEGKQYKSLAYPNQFSCLPMENKLHSTILHPGPDTAAVGPGKKIWCRG